MHKTNSGIKESSGAVTLDAESAGNRHFKQGIDRFNRNPSYHFGAASGSKTPNGGVAFTIVEVNKSPRQTGVTRHFVVDLYRVSS
jgi:hypothetical protein